MTYRRPFDLKNIYSPGLQGHGSVCAKCDRPYVAPVCARRAGGICNIKHLCRLCRMDVTPNGPDDAHDPGIPGPEIR
jgi:hypothetical protein